MRAEICIQHFPPTISNVAVYRVLFTVVSECLTLNGTLSVNVLALRLLALDFLKSVLLNRLTTNRVPPKICVSLLPMFRLTHAKQER